MTQIGNEGLIKRNFAIWNKLRTSLYYKQMALYTMLKNFTEERILHKLKHIKNNTETAYIKMCTTCLQQEYRIIHKPTDEITKTAERP